jgi:hypothetical protein
VPNCPAGGTRDIDGFLQSDGVTKYAFTFAVPEDASDSQAFTPLTSSMAESSARPATVADSIGRIRVQIFAATARQVLKVPEPPPPPPRTSYSAASASASASSLKRELGSVTPDDGQTAGKRGKVEAASSQPPADVGMYHQAKHFHFLSASIVSSSQSSFDGVRSALFVCAGFTALQKPSTTETDEKKFWKNSLGTTVGPMIAGPALDAEKSGSSASASSFGGSSSSASAPKSTPKPASTRPVLETKWELNHLLGTVTFRYSTFSGLVLSQIVKIEDPSDACMIPIDELSIHAVKVVAGVIKKGGDKYGRSHFFDFL